jgi:hypothetical protein
MTDDIIAIALVFACFYPMYLIIEALRKSTERAIKESLNKNTFKKDSTNG